MPSARDRPPPTVAGGPAVLEGATVVAFVATTDLDRAHAFYGDVLGLPRTEASPFANAYEAGGASLRVTRVDRLAPAAYTVLGWRVEALAVTLQRLAQAGVGTRRFAGLDQDADGVWTAPGGARIVWFEDPDGNLLSLTEPPPSARGSHGAVRTALDEAAAPEALLQPGRRASPSSPEET